MYFYIRENKDTYSVNILGYEFIENSITEFMKYLYINNLNNGSYILIIHYIKNNRMIQNAETFNYINIYPNIKVTKMLEFPKRFSHLKYDNISVLINKF